MASTDLSTRLRNHGLVEAGAGALFLIAPFFAGLTVVVALGALLLALGVLLTQAAVTLEAKGTPGRGLRILDGILLAILGACLALLPVYGLVVLTGVLGGTLITLGALRSAVGLGAAGVGRSGLRFLSGLLTIAAGTLLLLQWPSSGSYAIGTFVGASLLFDGALRFSAARSLRAAAQALTSP